MCVCLCVCVCSTRYTTLINPTKGWGDKGKFRFFLLSQTHAAFWNNKLARGKNTPWTGHQSITEHTQLCNPNKHGFESGRKLGVCPCPPLDHHGCWMFGLSWTQQTSNKGIMLFFVVYIQSLFLCSFFFIYTFPWHKQQLFVCCIRLHGVVFWLSCQQAAPRALLCTSLSKLLSDSSSPTALQRVGMCLPPPAPRFPCLFSACVVCALHAAVWTSRHSALRDRGHWVLGSRLTSCCCKSLQTHQRAGTQTGWQTERGAAWVYL